jgi:hypothetical protein
MKKLIVSLALVGASTACATRVVSGPAPVGASSGSGNVGAPDAVSAVRGFLAAAKEPDLRAMGTLFGDVQGPVRQSEDLEKREVIMARCLRHDSYDIVGDAPNPGGGRNFVVNLSFHEISRSANFQVVMGPERRWYVQSFDPTALNDICSRRA